MAKSLEQVKLELADPKSKYNKKPPVNFQLQVELASLQAQQEKEKRKKREEEVRAGKIKLNALRSRRSSNFFAEGGRETIG